MIKDKQVDRIDKKNIVKQITIPVVDIHLQTLPQGGIAKTTTTLLKPHQEKR
jgi:hypothetical protein